jgi:Peptidase A4 family
MSHPVSDAGRPDFNSRLGLTKKLLEGVRIPQEPPEGFDPLQGTTEELEKHGLPPRPDKEKSPDLAAKWERLMSQPLKFVHPAFKIVERDRVPLPTQVVKTADTSYSGNWSGAVLAQSGDEEPFNYVVGEWIVPNPYPSATVDATYVSGAWVGIDGWGSSGDVLQGGTLHDVVVSNGASSHSTYA